jgi:hypothetical protein
MWEDIVINIVKELKIVKSSTVIVDGSDNWVDIHTIYNPEEAPEANRFKIQPYRKDNKFYTIEFFSNRYPRRTCKELTEKELLYVIRLYCIPITNI